MSSSSESSGGWRRALVAASLLLPAAGAAALVAAYYQFSKEQKNKKKATGSKRKSGAARKGGVGSSNSPYFNGSSLTSALEADIADRSRGLPNRERAAKIWASIRRLTPDNAEKLYDRETRSQIGQWIVAVHATDPLTSGGMGGGFITTSMLQEKVKQEREDWEVAWTAFESIEKEVLRVEISARSGEEKELLRNVHLSMLDLSHKMKNAERLSAYYDKVKAHTTEPGASMQILGEQGLWTLWMMSSELGRWSDFIEWTRKILQQDGGATGASGSASLDQFHLLAMRKQQMLDLREMYRIATRTPDFLQTHPPMPARHMEWGQYLITASLYLPDEDAASTYGCDEKSLQNLLKHKPLKVWKDVAGFLPFQRIGASARISSMITPQMPVVGPMCIEGEDAEADPSSPFAARLRFDCSGEVLFKDDEHGLCKLQEEFIAFRLITNQTYAKKIMKKYRKKQKKEEEEKKDEKDERKETETEGEAEKTKEDVEKEKSESSEATSASTDETTAEKAGTASKDAAAESTDTPSTSDANAAVDDSSAAIDSASSSTTTSTSTSSDSTVTPSSSSASATASDSDADADADAPTSTTAATSASTNTHIASASSPASESSQHAADEKEKEKETETTQSEDRSSESTPDASSATSVETEEIDELPLSDYNPDDPPLVWSGTYRFKQLKVDEKTHEAAPNVEPFLHVTLKLVLKMQKPESRLR